MDAVIKEYGEYIIAVIACAIVIASVCLVSGFFDDASLDILSGQDVSGTGMLGKYICLWLNRIM